MEKFLSNLTDWSKFSPRILLALTIICGAFLFGGSDFFKTLGLDTIQTQFRSYFGLGFLFFGALFFSFPAAEVFKWIYNWLKRRFDQYQKEKRYKEWFTHLTPSQKEILRSFIENETRTRSLDYRDGTVGELMNAGIVYLPTNISFFERYPRVDDGMYTDFNIQPWVFKYLKAHPEILAK
ncbi:MAG: superinfection exclusion B family protein [Chloroflexi bacterium]|nr:superinfection exclusion B family protein [Chloroflexota bacterium]